MGNAVKGCIPGHRTIPQLFYQKIQQLYPKSTPNGQDIISPEDVEIGMLVYLVGNGNITLADSSEYPELERFRDARNNLAHLNILEPEDVELILKRAETL